MIVTFVGQDLPQREPILDVVPNSIFLAGPTPRSDDVKSWRPEALKLLAQQDFEGHVFVPESSDWGWLGDYDGQVRWEWEALGRAACVLFWVPRNLEDMPGFTTNVEFGFMAARYPFRVILAAPEDAPKLRYLRFVADECQQFHSSFRGVSSSARPILQTNSLKKGLMFAQVVATPD